MAYIVLLVQMRVMLAEQELVTGGTHRMCCVLVALYMFILTRLKAYSWAQTDVNKSNPIQPPKKQTQRFLGPQKTFSLHLHWYPPLKSKIRTRRHTISTKQHSVNRSALLYTIYIKPLSLQS